MGVNAGLVCRDCGVAGPEVGDFGHIGFPSLNDSPERMQGIHSFAYLYEGFKALRLLTGDLEAVRAFLRRHRRHKTVLMFEGDPEAESGQDDADEADGEDAGPSHEKLADGFYVLSCSCGSACRSTSAVRLRPFAPFRVTAKRAALFRERVVQASDDDFYRLVDDILEPLKDPRRFDAFLREHQGHAVTAELETRDEWSLLPEGRERDSASDATFASGADLPSRVLPRLTLSPPLKLVWSFDEDPMPVAIPFEDCVLAVRYEPATTFCLNLDGSVRWRVAMACRSPPSLGEGRPIVLFAEGSTQGVTRLFLANRDTGATLQIAALPYSPVLALPDEPAFIGMSHGPAGSHGLYRTGLALVALRDEPNVVWEIVEDRAAGVAGGIGQPCVHDGRVFLQRGQRFVCLGLADAREVWSVDLAPFGGPVSDYHRIAPARAGDVVITTVGQGLVAFDAATGTAVWKRADRLSGWAVSRNEVHLWTIENKADAHDTHWVVLEATSGREARHWSASETVYAACGLGRSMMTTEPVITEDYIFFGDLAGRIWAIERDSARPVWRDRPRGIRSWPLSMPAVKGGRLYFGRVSGEALPGRLYCYEES